jgi:hypothetical protein
VVLRGACRKIGNAVAITVRQRFQVFAIDLALVQ